MPKAIEQNQVTLKELLGPFSDVSQAPDVVIKGVASNSRLVRQDFLFFWVVGFTGSWNRLCH